MRILLCVVCLLFSFSGLYGNNQVATDENGDGKPDTWTVFDGGRKEAVYYDSDFDGAMDYATIFNKDGKLIEEQLDYNRDGTMDDFYFYDNEVLQRREMDTNYDGNIDVWVYLEEGIYITRYEQDVDFDGVVDKVKEFGPKGQK